MKNLPPNGRASVTLSEMMIRMKFCTSKKREISAISVTSKIIAISVIRKIIVISVISKIRVISEVLKIKDFC
jgi:hypothetical protein